jgi:hypothetical protein
VSVLSSEVADGILVFVVINGAYNYIDPSGMTD